MRAKALTAALGAAMLAGSMIGSVHAAPLASLVTGGQLNTFQDDSRELIFDVDGDGDFGVGDVNAGILRINERVTPGGLPLFGGGELIVAFSIQVLDITGSTVTWGPTTAAGFGVAELVEAFVPGGAFPAPTAAGTAIGAVFTDVGFNPITATSASVGDANGDGVLNYMDTIAAVAASGTPELVVGMNGLDDYFRGVLSIDPTAVPLSTIAAFSSNTPFGTFAAGLSILSNTSGKGFSEDVCAGFVPGGDPNAIPPPGCVPISVLLPGSLHDITVNNGTLSGASNFAISGDMNGTTPGGVDFFGVSNRAEVSVAPVPAPGALALISLGLLALPLSASIRRYRARS